MGGPTDQFHHCWVLSHLQLETLRRQRQALPAGVEAQGRQIPDPQFQVADAVGGVDVEAVEQQRGGSEPTESACGAGRTRNREATGRARRSQEAGGIRQP